MPKYPTTSNGEYDGVPECQPYEQDPVHEVSGIYFGRLILQSTL